MLYSSSPEKYPKMTNDILMMLRSVDMIPFGDVRHLKAVFCVDGGNLNTLIQNVQLLPKLLKKQRKLEFE
jgi:hypothetical protein